jgi:hypothetical protein
MQHLQDLAAVLLDPAPADALDLADAFERVRGPPSHFQRLVVRQQHVMWQGLAPGRVPTPLEQPVVPRTLRLVEFG